MEDPMSDWVREILEKRAQREERTSARRMGARPCAGDHGALPASAPCPSCKAAL